MSGTVTLEPRLTVDEKNETTATGTQTQPELSGMEVESGQVAGSQL